MNVNSSRPVRKTPPSQVQMKTRRLIKEAIKAGITIEKLRETVMARLEASTASPRAKQIGLAVFEDELRAALQ